MKKIAIITGGMALIAGAVAYYLLSTANNVVAESATPTKPKSQAAGEKRLRNALHHAKENVMG